MGESTEGRVPPVPFYQAEHKYVTVDGARTHYLELGEGSPLVLLHGGEYGANAEISWEYNLAELSRHYRVIAPDWLGYGQTDRLFDFVDRTGRAIRHMASFCRQIGIESAPFVGMSMGGMRLLRDAAAETPLLPMSAIVLIAGGGNVPDNEYRRVLQDYDCTVEGMRAIVAAIFEDRKWSLDDDYIARRHAASLAPGAWEFAAAARLFSPVRLREMAEAPPRDPVDYGRVRVPTLLVAGGRDKLKDADWGPGMAARIAGAELVVIPGVGHVPHIEDPSTFNAALLEFLGRL